MFRLIMSLILLMTPFAALSYWASGLIGGFRLWSKIPQKLRRWVRIYGLWTLLAGGTAGGVASMRGCISLGAIEAAAEFHPAGELKAAAAHSLGSIAPLPPKVLTRLKMQDALQAKELHHLETLRIRGEARQAILQFTDYNGDIHPRTRSGPFCHITCFAHHQAMYDRETLPEVCRANWIPPDSAVVPGWWPLSDKYEFTASWPGPATPGFHRYKLYWTDSK